MPCLESSQTEEIGTPPEGLEDGSVGKGGVKFGDSFSKGKVECDQGRYPMATYGLYMQPWGMHDPTCIHTKKQACPHRERNAREIQLKGGGIILPRAISRSDWVFEAGAR